MNVRNTRDRWEGRFQAWRSEKQERKTERAEKIEKAPEKEPEKKAHFLTEPKHVKPFKIIALIIPLVIIGYLVWANFIVSQDFDYLYDIGSENENYLTPVSRVSEIVTDGNENYRNLTDGLVYFDVPIARGADEVFVQARIKGEMPQNGKISLGAKDAEEWHYLYNLIYYPEFNLDEFDNVGNVYRINENLELADYEKLRKTDGIVIATNDAFEAEPNSVSDYVKKETVINTTLRGEHLFYVYAEGDLELTVKKQDLDWYEGEDVMTVSLYDSKDNLIDSLEIGEIGETGVSKKKAAVQTGELKVSGLKEGVYKIKFSDSDSLIREIKVNTNKIAADKLFLAGNEIYGVGTTNSKIYSESLGNKKLKFLTYHSAGIQKVSVVKDGKSKIFNFNKEDVPMFFDFEEGNYEMTFPENDVIISSPDYFSFSKENYFRPFKQKIISAGDDIDSIKASADYLIVDYSEPVDDLDWKIVETSFDITDDKLFVKDNKLSFVFNTPYLAQEQYKNYTISVDWIKITVHKPGVFSK